MFPYSNSSQIIQTGSEFLAHNPVIMLNMDTLEQMNAQIQILIRREEILSKQVQNLKESIQKGKQDIVQAVVSSIKQEFSSHMEQIKNIGYEKSFFRKNLNCPIKGCTRKYSSRIALRAHLRKNHGPEIAQTSDLKS